MNESSIVFCLSTDRRPQLRDAAAALRIASPAPSTATGLVVGNTTLDLDQWRQQHPRDFERACSALLGATAGPGQSRGGSGGALPAGFLVTALAALVPLAVGSLLTWLATTSRDAVGLRRQQAEALRSANLQFVQSAERYLRQRKEGSPGDLPSPDTLYERRSGLAAQVAQVAAVHPGWSLPHQVQQRLSTDLGGDLVSRPGRAAPDLVSGQLAKLRELTDAVERLALAHSRPARWHSHMRTAIMVGNDHAN